MFFKIRKNWNLETFKLGQEQVTVQNQRSWFTPGVKSIRKNGLSAIRRKNDTDVEGINSFENETQKHGNATFVDHNLLCRYTWLIRSCFPHCGTASVAQVSAMGLCPLLLWKLIKTAKTDLFYRPDPPVRSVSGRFWRLKGVQIRNLCRNSLKQSVTHTHNCGKWGWWSIDENPERSSWGPGVEISVRPDHIRNGTIQIIFGTMIWLKSWKGLGCIKACKYCAIPWHRLIWAGRGFQPSAIGAFAIGIYWISGEIRFPATDDPFVYWTSHINTYS